MNQAPSRTNPLLQPSPLAYGAVPFDLVQVEDFLPALTVRMTEAKANIERIKQDPEPPAFANVFAALETATAAVDDLAYLYSNLRIAHGDAGMHALVKEIMPKLIELASDINLDAALFARVQLAYDKIVAGTEKLSTEQRTLADKAYLSFKRNGGLLAPADKVRLRAIDDELSTLGPQFGENVLKATNAFALVITDRKDLAGLPPSAIEAAAASASERDAQSASQPASSNAGAAAAERWIFTLHQPSALPFLRYADNRELRQKLWMAANSRALHGEHSNVTLVKRIATLRHQRAQLLGFASHAAFQMAERMAEHPDNVRAFLARLLTKSRPAAERELADLTQFSASIGGPKSLMPWDYAYYANKLKEQRFALNMEELRPYFRLENVLAGVFEHARRLYDLEFLELKDLPVYAPGVQVFDVKDVRTGAHMGLFYTDFLPRPTKAGGAWCTRYRSQWQEADGSMVRPHVSIVCNFSRPTAQTPSLLSFQEATTLFHEFGHALHSLLSQCTYRSLACTSVYRDFVELPSQVMENWLKQSESLALFAHHFTEGSLIPAKLVEKMIASENFHAAYQMLRQLRFALLDMAWFSGDPSKIDDVAAFEQAAIKDTDLLPNVPGTTISCAFEHIFAGGYSAGYYGYKWAEVLDADAFELFQEKGIFAREVADRFRRAVLERGGTEHPMRLYEEFRGRAPDPDALLRRSQLI